MIARGSFTALSAAAVLTLTACGGGDASEPAATTPVTPAPATAEAKPKNVRQSVTFPARFERRIDAKCKRFEDDAKAIIRKDREWPESVRQIRDGIETLATDLEQIEAPARNKRAWRRYRIVFRQTADWVGRVESDVAEGDRRGFVRQAAALPALDGRVVKLSKRYGFAECADD